LGVDVACVNVTNAVGNNAAPLDKLLHKTCEQIGSSLLLLLFVAAIYACYTNIFSFERLFEIVYND
jgi:hypothetical protein